MNNFNEIQLKKRIKKLFDSFQTNHGHKLSEAKVTEILEKKLAEDIEKHIELSLGDVGLETLFKTIEIMKNGAWQQPDPEPTLGTSKKKAPKKKATSKRIKQ